MNFLALSTILLLFLSLESYNCATNHEEVVAMARLTKILLQAYGKPGRLTVMTCWNTDVSFKFYNTFRLMRSEGNRLNDFGVVIMKLNLESFPNAIEEPYEFIMIDLQCNRSTEILKLRIGADVANCGLIIWDTKQTKESEQKIIGELDAFPILPNSEVFYLTFENGTKAVHIQQIYRIGIGMPLILEAFGSIRNEIFIDQRSSSVTSRRRMNLLGFNFVASMVVTTNDTLNHLTDYRETQDDPITKVNYKLTGFLMSFLNATVNFTIVPSWGYRDDRSGEWSGMVGQLVRNEAELGASPLFMTVDRLAIIQYIASPTPTGSRFIFRSPKLSYTDNVFLLPFDDLVWYCLLLLVLVTAIVLTFAIFMEWNYLMPDKSGKHNECASLLRPKIGDVFLVIFGATCQQGSSVAPRSSTSRLIMIVAFTILMFLYTSYSANIVALLQSPSTKIQTLKDLYESRLEIGVDDTVFNRYYFTHAEEPVRKKIYLEKVLKKNGQDNFMTLEEGVKRVRKGLFAFHMELSLGYKLMSETFFEDEKCGIVEIAYLQVTDPWYAIKKNSSYKEMFKIGLMRMHEHGLQGRENARMYTKKPRCIGHTGNFITASLVDTKPALLVLLWGFGLTGMILIFELIVKHYSTKQLNRIHQKE